MTPETTTLCRIAKQAGAIIMEYYQQELDVQTKSDDSPVTAADLAANDYITKELTEYFPEIAIVSEENSEEANQAAKKYQRYFLIDPLDGTKSFIKKKGAFTVNIAIIENHFPIFGVIYNPLDDETYFTDQGKSYKQSGEDPPLPITVRTPPEEGITVVASHSHRSQETNDFIDQLQHLKQYISASSSLKFCLIAEGKADLYPRFGHTMQWDTAAGQAIVEQAGGKVEWIEGGRFSYESKQLLNPFFKAQGQD